MRSGASSPRSTPTATGKNARYDAITATEIHCGHGNPPRSICVPMLATSGANAMSGTVWLTTIQGSRPHSARRQRCMTRPSAAPTSTPMSQPTAAMPSVVSAALMTVTNSGGVVPPLVDWNSRATISQMCGIARSFVRGSSMTPEPVSPVDRADDESLGRTEELVQLPDHHDREHADDTPQDGRACACGHAVGVPSASL